MHYLRNQTENYCAEAKHTEQKRGRRVEWKGGRGRRQWIGVWIERRWERGKEESPVQICCWIWKGKEEYRFEVMRRWYERKLERLWKTGAHIYVFRRGDELIHAVDHENTANERDDAVLMTCSPRGRGKLWIATSNTTYISFCKDQSSQRPSCQMRSTFSWKDDSFKCFQKSPNMWTAGCILISYW